mgnify:CR=1 FL=1
MAARRFTKLPGGTLKCFDQFVNQPVASDSSSEEEAGPPRQTVPSCVRRKSKAGQPAKQPFSKQSGQLPPLVPATAIRGGRRGSHARAAVGSGGGRRSLSAAETRSSTAAEQLGTPELQPERVGSPSWEGGAPLSLGVTLPPLSHGGTPRTPPSRPLNSRGWSWLAASRASASASGLQWPEEAGRHAEKEAAAVRCAASKAEANATWARGEYAKCAEQLSVSIAVNSRCDVLRRYRAKAASRAGDDDAAVRDAHRAVALNARGGLNHACAAVCLERDGARRHGAATHRLEALRLGVAGSQSLPDLGMPCSSSSDPSPDPNPNPDPDPDPNP